MNDEISIFEAFFRTSLLGVAELVECVGPRVFNSAVTPKAELPYYVFTVIPLGDNTGQARTSIQTWLLVDGKFVTEFPVPATIAPAVMAVKEFFRDSLTFDSEGFRISVRHDRPINLIEGGVTADARLLHRGSSFRVWMSTFE